MDERRVPLRVTFDRAANAAYIHLRDIENGGVAKTAVGVDSTVNLDFDSHDRLIGVEVLNATSSLPAEVLRDMRVTGSTRRTMPQTTCAHGTIHCHHRPVTTEGDALWQAVLALGLEDLIPLWEAVSDPGSCLQCQQAR